MPAEPYAAADQYAPPVDPYTPPVDPYASAGASYTPAAADPYVPAASDPYVPAEPHAYEDPAHEGPAYEEPASSQTGAVAQEGPYEPPYGPHGTVEPRGPAGRDDAHTGRGRGLRAALGARTGRAPRAAKEAGARAGSGTAAPATEGRPLSRVEARRAARAAKESVGVVASRVVGELFITFGVLMLLFVAYQLWWTNVLAGQETDRAKAQIEDTWSKGGGDSAPEAFEPGKGFAIMYIPKLDVVVPIAEGTSKTEVLDKGMVGHYGEGKLKTAMPADKQGNFAVAGHRNTHGEPFRYINQLKPGDPIVVETQNAYYTYEMTSILPQTSPSNVSVIDPVPKQSGFKGPGRYITLTTCTPEFTSTYRMIVWGKLVEERPRSKGKPKPLVG
ncbi:class E sortase [Streptomyces diastatochromogenes]|nr:class E sortase [Streptomyces diastatochromogenes]